MDPIEQIFTQARAPTGLWEGASHAFFQGQQAGLQRSQLGLQQRRLQMEEAMQPLKMQAEQLQMREAAAGLDLKLLQKQRDAQILEGQAEAMRIMLDAGSKDGGYLNPEVADRIQNLATRNPAIFTHPTGQALVHSFRGAQVAHRAMEDAKSQGLPIKRIEAVRDREGATEQITFERVDPMAQQRIDNERLRITLQQAGLGLREIDQMLKAREQGFEISGQPTIPIGGTPGAQTEPGKINFTPIARPPTTGALTQSQEQSLNADQALSALNDAMSAIKANPTAIGVRGIIGENLEKAKGQLNPNAPLDTPTTDTRQKASIAFSRVAKSLRVDSGNMSRYELNKLEQAGDVLSFSEAPQTAQNKLNNLKAAVIGQKLRQLKFQNATVTDSVLREIPDSEVEELFNANLLTLDQALRWKNLKP